MTNFTLIAAPQFGTDSGGRCRCGLLGTGLATTVTGCREPDEIVRLERQMVTLRRGIGRLIDSYAEDVIDKAEFEPRIAGLKQRLSQLQERHRAAVEMAENERDLSLLISRLEDFSAKVTAGLAGLDRAGMRQIIRSVVRRVEIDDANIEVIFRVPPLDGPARPKSPRKGTSSTQHCTDVRGAHLRVARPMPPPRQGLGVPQYYGPLPSLNSHPSDS